MHAQSTRFEFLSRSDKIVRFDNESVNHGLPVLEAARGLDSWHRPGGSLALATRMVKD